MERLRVSRFFLFAGALALLAGLVVLSFGRPDAPAANAVAVHIGDTTIAAERADTPRLRELGLSGRDELCASCGMLFVFDAPGRYGLWMKEMRFPIDIIWLDEQKTVIGIARGASPDSYPEIFYPPRDIRYALEVPAGFSDAQALAEDSLVSFSL